MGFEPRTQELSRLTKLLLKFTQFYDSTIQILLLVVRGFGVCIRRWCQGVY